MEMQTTGFDELIAELEGMEISEQKEKKALSEAGEVFKQAFEENIAVDTGRSKRNIKKTIKRLEDGNLGCKVYINSWYYKFEEYGNSKNKKNIGRIARAIENVTDEAVKKAKDILLPK